MTKPEWLKVPWRTHSYGQLARHFKEEQVHTVCEEALCPNRSECWKNRTATYMILGDTCTRACRFCHVKTGKPLPPDPEEPMRLLRSCQNLGLSYVVVTMVDRDDLEDGGQEHVHRVIEALRSLPVAIELLAGDFKGRRYEGSRPDVWAHNLETVRRLTPRVRDRRASYEGSLKVLEQVRQQGMLTKSSLMLGLGETDQEIEETLKDLRDHGVSMVTLGQYLQPTRKHLPVVSYVTPEAFAHWADIAHSLGFACASGPLVRSSYQAKALWDVCRSRS